MKRNLEATTYQDGRNNWKRGCVGSDITLRAEQEPRDGRGGCPRPLKRKSWKWRGVEEWWWFWNLVLDTGKRHEREYSNCRTIAERISQSTVD